MENKLLNINELVIGIDYLFEISDANANKEIRAQGFYRGLTEYGYLIFDNIINYNNTKNNLLDKPGRNVFYVKPNEIKVYNASEYIKLRRSEFEDVMIKKGIPEDLAKANDKYGKKEKSKRKKLKKKSKSKKKSKRKLKR
jgi:hypothetical protein